MTARSPILCACLASLIISGAVQADPFPVNFVSPPTEYSAGSLNKNNGWSVANQAPANADFVIKPAPGCLWCPTREGRTRWHMPSLLTG